MIMIIFIASHRIILKADRGPECDLNRLLPQLGCKFSFSALRSGSTVEGTTYSDEAVIDVLGFVIFYTPQVCAGMSCYDNFKIEYYYYYYSTIHHLRGAIHLRGASIAILYYDINAIIIMITMIKKGFRFHTSTVTCTHTLS